MSPIVFLVVVATLATFVVMMAGGVSMSKGGSYDEVHAFPLMEARVILHAITLFMVIMAFLFW